MKKHEGWEERYEGRGVKWAVAIHTVSTSIHNNFITQNVVISLFWFATCWQLYICQSWNLKQWKNGRQAKQRREGRGKKEIKEKKKKKKFALSTQFSSVQSLSRVQLFVTPWIRARLSITNSRSSLKLMSIESVMPSSHLIPIVPFSSCPQSLPASESFPMSQLFAWGGQLEFQLQHQSFQWTPRTDLL